MKTCKEIIVDVRYTTCPYCGQPNDGWPMDPRGKEEQCEFCGKTYYIPTSLDLEFE